MTAGKESVVNACAMGFVRFRIENLLTYVSFVIERRGVEGERKMAESEIDYARRRTAEELDRADQCSDPTAAHVHRRLAVLYANMVAEMHHLTPIELAEQIDMPQARREMPMPQQSTGTR